jgi:hypothetical protein
MQGTDPQWMRVGKSGMHYYHVSRTGYIVTSVTVDYVNISSFSKVRSGPLHNFTFTIDGNHPSLRTDQFG